MDELFIPKVISDERYTPGDGVVEFEDGSSSTSVMFFILSTFMMRITPWDFSQLWSYIYPQNHVTMEDVALGMLIGSAHVNKDVFEDEAMYLDALLVDIDRAGYPELSNAVVQLTLGNDI